jgi:hypothetical protein
MPIQTSIHLSQIRELELPSMNNVEGRENLDKAASEATKKPEGPHVGFLDHVLASSSLRVSHRARLYAASRCGTTSSTKSRETLDRGIDISKTGDVSPSTTRQGAHYVPGREAPQWSADSSVMKRASPANCN